MAGSDASKANVLPLAIFFATLVAIDVSYLAIFFVTLAAMRNFSQGATSSAVNSSPTSTSSATSSATYSFTTPASQSAQPQTATSSPSPAQSAASSVTTPALQSAQQHASTSATPTSSAVSLSTTAAPQATQPQTAPSSSGPAQSAVASRSTSQLVSNPYSLAPTYRPALDDPLPFELWKLLIEYGVACFNLLNLLLKYATEETRDGVRYVSGPGNVLRKVDVQEMKTHDNGMTATIPYVQSIEYLNLFNSIRRRYQTNPAELANIRRELLHWVEIAIAGRSAVHDWYLCLPANDARVVNNPKHAAFLGLLIRLRNQL